jgi:hypothetical protein
MKQAWQFTLRLSKGRTLQLFCMAQLAGLVNSMHPCLFNHLNKTVLVRKGSNNVNIKILPAE